MIERYVAALQAGDHGRRPRPVRRGRDLDARSRDLPISGTCAGATRSSTSSWRPRWRTTSRARSTRGHGPDRRGRPASSCSGRAAPAPATAGPTRTAASASSRCATARSEPCASTWTPCTPTRRRSPPPDGSAPRASAVREASGMPCSCRPPPGGGHPGGVMPAGRAAMTPPPTQEARMAEPFNGIINLDVRDSTPDWEPFMPPRAPDGLAERPDRALRRHRARGVVAVRRPHRDADAEAAGRQRADATRSGTRPRSARRRARASSPAATTTRTAWPASPRARSAIPGGNAHIPPECGTLAEVMRQAGWSTFWLGKNHSVPVDDLHAGSTKETWPLHQGCDRFYGFLGGETNQWYPDLTVDNHHDRAAVHPGGGLPPLEGPGRPGDPDDPRRQGRRRRRGRGSCGSARARTTPRTTRRRSASTSTRASSTTATRPTASGCCRA